jgi:hypothetical protein
VAGRGSDLIFSQLFASPYGAPALAAHLAAAAEEEKHVFGVSASDRQRMRNYLELLARSEQSSRLSLGLVGVGTAGLTLGVLVASKLSSDGRPTADEIATTASIGGATLAASLWYAFGDGPSARALARFDQRVNEAGADWPAIVAETETYLAAAAAREARYRRWMTWISGAVAGSLAVTGTVLALVPSARASTPVEGYVLTFGGAAMIGALTYATAHQTTPVEQMLDLYRRDPTLNVSIAPVAGGGAVAISGRF